jgi:hypothetical protein
MTHCVPVSLGVIDDEDERLFLFAAIGSDPARLRLIHLQAPELDKFAG